MSYTTKYNFTSSCEELRKEIPEYSQDKMVMYEHLCDPLKLQYASNFDFNNKYTCQQVMYILNDISSKPTSEHNDNRCKYLYNWTYHDLLQNNTNYDMALKLYRSFLQKYFDDYEDHYICKDYMDGANDIMLKRTANLIELYDTFNKNTNAFDCECAKKCSDLYKEYVGECHNDYDHDYCKELENFKHKYDNNMKSIEPCDDAEKILPSALKNDLHVVIIIPMIIVTILSFLVFALYKFTSIGSRINRRKRRKNVFFENQLDRTNTLLPTSGRTRRKEQNTAYNIAYDNTTYS